MKLQKSFVRLASALVIFTITGTGCGSSDAGTKQNQSLSSEVVTGSCKVEIALESLANPTIQSTQSYTYKYRERITYSADGNVESFEGTTSGMEANGTEWGPDKYSGTETFIARTQVNDTDYEVEFITTKKYEIRATSEVEDTTQKTINTIRNNPDGTTTLLKSNTNGLITGETYTRKITDIEPDTIYVVTTYANLDRYQSSTHRTTSRVKTCRITTTK